MELPQYIKNIAKITPSFEKEFESIFTRKELSKGDFLFEQGHICHQIFFIEKGLARVYYYSESGKEITAWFSPENTFITAVDSLIQHKPTRNFCELLEDSVVYSMTYSELESMLNKEHGARLAFYALFDITKKMTEFIVSIKFQSAEERYKTLWQNYPSIFQRASLGHIASYLGITQETLSRIRTVK